MTDIIIKRRPAVFPREMKMPRYREASYAGETSVLENRYLRLELHKRITGWGWGELLVGKGQDGPSRFFAILENLAEAHIAGHARPLRLEAKESKLAKTEASQALTFEVQSREALSSNHEGGPLLKGSVTLELPTGDAVIRYRMRLVAQAAIELRSLRGIWLRIGAGSFGSARHDAIFPGIDWVVGDEWSSGTDWFEHPEALRVAPHPYKVAIPVMALSHDGVAISLSWDPHQSALSHVSRIRCPQPVFATPNFIDRMNHHLFGLMLPSARWGLRENQLEADPPVPVPRGMRLDLDAAISVVNGTSLDAVVEWVRRNGMPDPGAPRYDWEDALDRIAEAYNSHLWVDGQGWGFRGRGSPNVPRFVLDYARHGRCADTARGLKEKVAWCLKQQGRRASAAQRRRAMIDDAENLLKLQTPEGDFPFDPAGRHKTNLTEKAALWRPLGLPGDSALDLCATASIALLQAGEKLHKERFLEAARKALEFAMRFERPEGGDWWETPLRSPNLLAAGNAAIAYYLGYRDLGDERYLERARHFIRCLLPFTHLWQPMDVSMIYNTKPCFNSTCWFLSDWTSKHVQWEVLSVFHKSDQLGIDWAKVDPEIDWETYQRGVTTAVLRWMIDHDDPQWMFRSEFSAEAVREGAWDTLFADTFDPVNDTYGGGPIMPEIIAANVQIVMKRLARKRPSKRKPKST